MQDIKPKKIIDISPLLSPNIAVWPGDTAFSRKVICEIKNNNIELSSLHSTVHLGAHADAEFHYHKDGRSIDRMDLENYIGPCVVTTVLGKKLIDINDCKSLENLKPERVLFRTLSQPDINVFNKDFTAIAPDTIEYLAQLGVKLVGIDTHSVDPFDSKDLLAHQMLYKHHIVNIEGLYLENVKDGPYEFIGLPLKLQGFDGSPIRAILREI